MHVVGGWEMRGALTDVSFVFTSHPVCIVMIYSMLFQKSILAYAQMCSEVK